MKYYFLASYLPELHRDDIKIRVSLGDLLEERYTIPEEDWNEIALVLLGRDVVIVERLLAGKSAPVEHSLYPLEFWRDQVKAPREGPEFILEYLKGVDLQAFGVREIDRLYGLYFDHVLETTKSAFLRDYFSFQKDLRNVVAALRARQKGIEPAEGLVGEGELVETLGSSAAEDFGLGREYPWLEVLIKAEAPHRRQEEMERILWEYLDDHAGADPFGFNVILAYLLKLEILHRRLALSEEQGMEKVRRLGGL